MPASSPKPEIRRGLESILIAGSLVIDWTADINEHRLWADKLKRAAVERQFEVIAEALIRLPDQDPRVLRMIPDANVAIRLGEAIRHKYDKIDYGILWRATRNDLPQLIQKVQELLTSASQ